jgi:hypothetical protein
VLTEKLSKSDFLVRQAKLGALRNHLQIVGFDFKRAQASLKRLAETIGIAVKEQP